MPVVLDWKQIIVRLALTVLAGVLIGFNRSEHGRPAGMRTTLLVCLAASLSMILANAMMNSVGKTSDSFVVLDLMRLPLGVLSGMGFIGAGTILRKGSLILGITTAATLWYVTVMGLCFGAGQFMIGFAALLLGWATLWALKYVEGMMLEDLRGNLKITLVQSDPSDDALQGQCIESGCRVVSWGGTYSRNPLRREIQCELQWRTRSGSSIPPSIIEQLRSDPAILQIAWEPQGIANKGDEQQQKPEGTPVIMQTN